MSFSKHSGVIAAFGQHFAKKGKVPIEFHRYLLDAMEARQEGDYNHASNITPEKAQIHLTRAEEFLSLAENLLGPVSS